MCQCVCACVPDVHCLVLERPSRAKKAEAHMLRGFQCRSEKSKIVPCEVRSHRHLFIAYVSCLAVNTHTHIHTNTCTYVIYNDVKVIVKTNVIRKGESIVCITCHPYISGHILWGEYTPPELETDLFPNKGSSRFKSFWIIYEHYIYDHLTYKK